MRRAFFPLLFALLPCFARAEDRPGCGTIDSVEVRSLTRTKLTALLNTTLPNAVGGGAQRFTGEIEVANTPIPLGPVSTAPGQPGSGGNAVVLALDLDLAKIPQTLLAKLNPLALDVTLRGALSGAGRASVRICAAGILRIGTQDVRAAAPVGESLAGFSGPRLTGISLTEVEGQATATLFNPLGFPLDVESLAYAVWAGDRKLAEGERRGVRLHAGRENAIDLPVRASAAELLTVLGGGVAGDGRVAGRLVAQVSIRVGKGQLLTVPLDLPGSVQVLP